MRARIWIKKIGKSYVFFDTLKVIETISIRAIIFIAKCYKVLCLTGHSYHLVSIWQEQEHMLNLNLSLCDVQEHMLNLNLSLCDLPTELHNISNLSALCSPEPPSSLPPPVMTIIQIFYGLICLLGLIGGYQWSFHKPKKIKSLHFLIQLE